MLSVLYQVHFQVYSVELHSLYIFLLKCSCFLAICLETTLPLKRKNDLIYCQLFGMVVEF